MVLIVVQIESKCNTRADIGGREGRRDLWFVQLVIIEEAYLEVFAHLHICAGFDTPQALSCGGLALLFHHFADQGHVVTHGDIRAQIDGGIFQYLHR